MTHRRSRTDGKATWRGWITLVLGVVALFALATTVVLPGVAVADGGASLSGVTKDDLQREGFTCEFQDINGGVVICTRDTIMFVCDKDGQNCVQAPLPGSKLTKGDLEKDGFTCKFHNISGGTVICTKGGTTYYCDKFGDSCKEGPRAVRGIQVTRS